jgi:type I restriction enzyme S subunit
MRVLLKDLIRVHYGKSLKAEDRQESGLISVYGSSGKVGNHSEALFSFPSIVIGRKGSVGAITFAPEGGWVIDTAFYVEILDTQKTDLRYLYYALKDANLVKHTITTSIPGINRDDIYKTTLPLPPLAEQQRIAAILDKADALREKRRQSLAKLDTLLQSVFLEMFGDEKLSHYVDAGSESSHLNLRWTWAKLTDVARLATGHTPSRRVSEYWGGDIPWICLTDIRSLDGQVATKTIECTNEKGIKNSAAVKLPAGTVCFSRTASVGFVTIMGREMATSQDFVNWVCGPQLNPVYLMWALIYSRTRLRALSTGSTHKTIYFPTVEEFRVALPPIELQNKFAVIAQNLAALKQNIEKVEAKSQEFFQSLQQRAFTGELFAAEARAAVQQELFGDGVA